MQPHQTGVLRSSRVFYSGQCTSFSPSFSSPGKSGLTSMPTACPRSEMVLWLTYALETFWSPLTAGGARMLLRYVLALKCGSFALGALQLRSGYPPAAASSGMGRQSFWFMRHVNSSKPCALCARGVVGRCSSAQAVGCCRGMLLAGSLVPAIGVSW